jgi:hypothetical protein
MALEKGDTCPKCLEENPQDVGHIIDVIWISPQQRQYLGTSLPYGRGHCRYRVAGATTGKIRRKRGLRVNDG